MLGGNFVSRLVASDDRTSFRPAIFDLSVDADLECVAQLLASGGVVIHDTIHEQLEELISTLNPSQDLSAADRELGVRRRLDGCPMRLYGRWIYYPWARRLVHTLPPDEYFVLRSDRNRNKISLQQQELLRSFTIGVVGLSVGQASAITLAMEGIGGRFRLADFDVLSLSNMNRLRAGIHDVGVPKTILAARAMYEMDPYLSIDIFSTGITPDNSERFFLEGGRLDLIVEECDDLQVKLSLRERARAHRIPVIMETSDRGMVDIERFDLEPDRPILHGLLGGLRADTLANLSTKDKVPYVLRILDDRSISDAFAASLVEVKESIYTWPQLASAIALGGAIATDAARRILLGSFQQSGRFYVDVEALVSDGSAIELTATEEPKHETHSDDEHIFRLPERQSGRLSREEARFLVAYASLAPSGGNQQPWRFEFSGSKCNCFLDEHRTGTFLDYDDAASILAIGAALENFSRAAAVCGLDARVAAFPDPSRPGLVAEVDLSRSGEPLDTQELAVLRWRVTNRRRGNGRALSEADANALRMAAERAGVHLRLSTDRADIVRVAALLGRCDRLRFLSPIMHRELVAELRWTEDDVRSTRTGIDLPSLELTPADEAAMRVISRWGAMDRVKAFGGGKALERPAQKMLGASAAIGLLSKSALGRKAYLDGGRGLQRVWLEASGRKVAFQPYSSLIYLLARLERGNGIGLSEDERATLGELRWELDAVFPKTLGDTELLLFRLAYADEPTSRSLRLPVDDVFSFAL